MLSYLARHVIYPLHERLLRRPTFDYLEELERSQWYSRDEIEALQLRKLNALLRLSLAHSPWHAERISAAGLHLDGAGLTNLADLRQLPTMTKQDASEHMERIVWRTVPGGVFQYNTGGSTGRPLIFYYGRKRQAADAAGRIRARRWWGIEVGDREVYLWGAPVELHKTDHIKMLRDRLLNQLLLNAFEMSPSNMDDYIVTIQHFQPKCIYGYASSIALLAAHVQDRDIKLKLPYLKVVCTTGEPLYPYQRVLIQDVFKVPVVNEFGSRDAGLIAHETPEGQLLLMSESNILEVLDEQGQPVAPGRPGEAVITGLCSEAQPFIRYRTGDIVQWSDAYCKTGRGLHVLKSVMGRTTDFILRADGTIMHALAVIYVLRAVKGVGEFKFVQHTVDAVEVLIVPNSHWCSESGGIIVSGIRARLGEDVRVELRMMEAIPPEASGKHRYVVSHLPLQTSLNVAQQTGQSYAVNSLERPHERLMD